MLIPKQKPKAIIIDVDSTLTERITWYALTEQLGGSTREHAEIFISYLSKDISYEQLKKNLFKIWTTNGPATKEKIISILENIALKGEAHSFINELQSKNIDICFISSSMKLFVEILAKRFSVKYWYGNSNLLFDKHQNLIDFDYDSQEAKLKLSQLNDFLSKTKYKPSECIAIGNNSNDIEIFRVVPGITLSSKSEHLSEIAWRKVKYLPRVLQIIDSI